MERITEIQARLAEIQTELEAATGEALTVLETESCSLLDELNGLKAEVESRKQLRSRSLQAQAPPCRHPLPFRYQLRKERQKNSQPPDV